MLMLKLWKHARHSPYKQKGHSAFSLFQHHHSLLQNRTHGKYGKTNEIAVYLSCGI